MPIRMVDPAQRTAFPSGQDRLEETLHALTQYGDPLASLDATPALPDSFFDKVKAASSDYAQSFVRTGGFNPFFIGPVFLADSMKNIATRITGDEFLDTWGATYRTTLSGVGVDRATRFLTADSNVDFDFNPATFIMQDPKLRNDPIVQELTIRGQFDDAINEEDFYYALESGKQWFNDMLTLQESTRLSFWTSQISSMVLDPLNLIALAPAAKAGIAVNTARNISTLQRVATVSAYAGAGTFAYEKALNTLQPASNDPGPINEIAATLFGATIGATLGYLTSPATRTQFTQFVSTRKMQQLQRDMVRMMEEPVFTREAGATTTTATAPVRPQPAQAKPTIFDRIIPFFKQERAAADAQTLLVSLQDEIKAGQAQIAEALTELPVPNKRISAAYIEGDETHKLIQQLQQKYDDAGQQLHVTQPPEQQRHLELYTAIAEVLDHPVMRKEAIPADFNYGAIDTAMSTIATRYAEAQGIVNPAGRLMNSTLGVFNDVLRTLSGSAQTVLAGSAADPLNFPAGTAAENIIGQLGGVKDRSILDTRLVYKKIANEPGKAITYNGQTIRHRWDGEKFREAVTHYRQQQHAQRMGYPVDMPDAHPLIREASSHVNKYWLHMADQLEQVDSLHVGPRTVARETQRLNDIDTGIKTLQRDIATEQQTVNEAVETLYQQGNFSRSDIDKRLSAILDDRPTSLDMANEIIRARIADDSANLGVDQFAIHPDDLERFSPPDRARLSQLAPITEDADTVKDIIGDDMYWKAIDELLGGRTARMRNLIDEVANSSHQYDPNLELDAALAIMFDSTAPGERVKPRVIVDPQDLPEGVTFSVFGHDFTVRMQDGVKMIENDDWIFSTQEISRMPVDADSIERLGIKFTTNNKNARPKVARLKAKLQRLETNRMHQVDRIARAEQALADLEFYTSHIFDIPVIMQNRDAFVRDIAASFEKASHIVNRKPMPEGQRPLVPGAVNALDANELITLAQTKTGKTDMPFTEAVAALTDGDLPPATRTLYDKQRAAYFEEAAGNVYTTLTSPEEAHGVADAFSSDPLMARTLEVDETTLSKYMIKDIEQIMERYHRVIAGRTAVKRAIQLNPDIWRTKMVRDAKAGRMVPVSDSKSMTQYLNRVVGQLNDFAHAADSKLGPEGRSPLVPSILRLKTKVERDIIKPLNLLEGRAPLSTNGGVMAGIGAMGNNLIKLSYLNKMGSFAWAQLNDLAPLTMYALQNPTTLKMLYQVPMGFKDLPKRDLEVLGLAFDNLTRIEAYGDYNYANSSGVFGDGMVRTLSSKVDAGLKRASDVAGHVSMMNAITDFSKQIAGTMVLDRTMDLSRKLIKASDLVDGGMDLRAALRQVGFESSGYEVARLNKLGFNVERSRRFHEMVYRHGTERGGKPVREVMTFAEYMNTRKVINPGFDDWKFRSQADRDLFQIITSNINAEVNRYLVVTPGVFDRPLINMTVMGRLFNQFQSFGMAYANQRLRTMGQMPAKYQLWYYMNYMMLGAMSDAVSNHLAGRRTFSETAQLWQENPAGMMYAAWDRSGLSGWLGRPLAILDAMNVPFAPGVLLKNQPASSASRHIRGDNLVIDTLGPAATDVGRAFEIGRDLLGGREIDNRTAFNVGRLAPLQNLLWLRMLHSATGLPVVPEAFLPPKKKQEPTP